MTVSDRLNGSAADELFVSGRLNYGGHARITEGPLADFDPHFDPISYTENLRRAAQAELEKQARVAGGPGYDSPSGPGADRTVQGTPDPNAYDQNIQQTPTDAAAQKPEADKSKPKPAPSTGASGSSLLSKIKAQIEKSVETRGVSGHGETATDAKGLSLAVREPAPVPKELKPGNLANGAQRSAWTGSGPQAAMDEGRDKVSSYEDVNARLEFAGVPLARAGAAMRDAASWVLTKAASDDEKYLARDDVHPLKLLAELDDMFGSEWRQWEPETISQSVEKTAGVQMSDAVMNKVMAVKIALMRPDAFFDDCMAMEKMAVAFNDAAPAMGVVEDMPVEWLSNAVAIMTKIAGQHDFSPETTTYVAARLFDNGYVVAPPLLRFADAVLGEKVANDDLRRKTILAYADAIGSGEAVDGEDAVDIQVARLMRNHSYVLDKLEESQAQVGM